VSVYSNKCLECAEAYIKNMMNLIFLKGQECCVCKNKQVSIWLVDEANLTRGLAVYVRLFCHEHEMKWKEAKRLNYNMLNGVMLIELPYQKPVGLWTNFSWSDFLTLLTNYFGDRDAIEKKLLPELFYPCEEFLKQNSKFVLKGTLEDYLKT
jgi:hypothetical protein